MKPVIGFVLIEILPVVGFVAAVGVIAVARSLGRLSERVDALEAEEAGERDAPRRYLDGSVR